MNINIGDLVYGAQNGDREACSKLYQLTVRSSYYLALRITGNESATRALVKKCYIKVFEDIGTLKDPEKLEKWIKHITASLCIDYLKSIKSIDFCALSSATSGMIDEKTEFLPKGIEKAENVEKAINKVIDLLPDRQRAVTVLHYFNEMPTFYIAKMLGCDENNVCTELAFARERIKNNVEKMTDKSIDVYPMGTEPILASIMRSAKQKQTVDESFLRSAFAEVTKGKFASSDDSAVSDEEKNEAKPPKKQMTEERQRRNNLIIAICAVAAAVITAVCVLLVPRVIDRMKGVDNQQIDAKMLSSIETYEETYENLLLAFSQAVSEDEDAFDAAFNFVYFNDNDIPDVTFSYKKYYENSDEAYNTSWICIDGLSEEIYNVDAENTWVGEKGYYIEYDYESDGGEIREIYCRYRYNGKNTARTEAGWVEYQKLLTADGYWENWLYTPDTSKNIIELDGWDSFNQKKTELLSGLHGILCGYRIEDYIASGKKLVKYLKKAQLEYFSQYESSETTSATEAGETSTEIQSETQTEEKASTTQTVSGDFLEASANDFKVLEHNLSSIMYFNDYYNYKTDNAYDMVMTDRVPGMVYDDYFEYDWDTGYADDPLNRFDRDEYSVYDAEGVDWIITNVFNQKPNHNVKTSKYYYYNGKYYCVFLASGGSDMEVEIKTSERQADGSYKFTILGTHIEYESRRPDNYTVHAALKNVDGKRIWSIFSIGNGKARPSDTTTTTAPVDNTPEWEKNYMSLLEEKAEGAFLLKDIDANGIPELFWFDRWAQTDFIYMYVNGNCDEDEEIPFGGTDLYMNNNGDYGVYATYHSGKDIYECYSKAEISTTGIYEILSVSYSKDGNYSDPPVEKWIQSREGTETVITKEEYDAEVQKFKNEFTKLQDTFVTDFLNSGDSLSKYIK